MRQMNSTARKPKLNSTHVSMQPLSMQEKPGFARGSPPQKRAYASGQLLPTLEAYPAKICFPNAPAVSSVAEAGTLSKLLDAPKINYTAPRRLKALEDAAQPDSAQLSQAARGLRAPAVKPALPNGHQRTRLAQ